MKDISLYSHYEVSSAFIPNFLFRTDEYIDCSGIIWEEEIKL